VHQTSDGCGFVELDEYESCVMGDGAMCWMLDVGCCRLDVGGGGRARSYLPRTRIVTITLDPPIGKVNRNYESSLANRQRWPDSAPFIQDVMIQYSASRAETAHFDR
jgi:hypothetical protein